MKHRTAYIGVFVLLVLGCKSAAGSGVESPGYVVRGKVVSAEVKPEERGAVVCHLTLDFEFINTASEPVILLQPSGKLSFWVGGKRLAKTYDDAALGRNLLHDSQQWLSVMDTPEFRELANRLDKPLPPADVTRILKPGEAWKYRRVVSIFFPKTRDYCTGAPCIAGDELTGLSPLWLTLQFEMWPSNVENFKPDLGGRLSRRWDKVGRLWVGKKSKFWFAAVTTEPILLDLRGAGKVQSL